MKQLLISVLSILLMIGCTTQTQKETINIDSIVNKTQNSNQFEVEQTVSFEMNSQKIKTTTTYLFDHEKTYLKFAVDDEVAESYYINERQYIEQNGSKVYLESENPKESIMQQFYLQSSVEAIKNGDILHFEWSDKEPDVGFIVEALGVDASMIKNVKVSIEGEADTRLRKFEKKYTFDYNGASVSLSESTQFKNYDDVSVVLPEDLDSYVAYDEQDNLDKLKQNLVEMMQYEKDNERYTLAFNGNERFIFDFNTNTFIYVLAQTMSYYNFKTDQGTYLNCIYDFNFHKDQGNCSEEDITRIKETKIYLGIELADMGMGLSDLR